MSTLVHSILFKLFRMPSPLGVFLIVAVSGLTMGYETAAAQTPQPSTTRYEYDANGNLTRIVDPLGHVTVQRYDASNRLVQQQLPAPVTAASAPVIVYHYDARDQLTGVKDPRNLSTLYTIDGLGNQAGLASPDSGVTGRTFDAAGNLTSSRDARGQLTTFERDALGRVTRVVYASGVPTVFEYDSGSAGAVGRLSKMSDESGQTNYIYDDAGRLISKRVAIGAGGSQKSFTVGYTYGASGPSNGKVIGMAYPSGNHVSIEYGEDGRAFAMFLVKAGATTRVELLSEIQYHPSGAVQSWKWGNHSDAVPNRYIREFDLSGRITRLPLGNVLNGGTIRSITYDAAGRIIKTEHVGTGLAGDLAASLNQSYAYDERDRLTHFVGNGTTARYQYDASGNRTQLAYGGKTFLNAISSTSNQLQKITGPSSSKTNGYDAAGNLSTDGTINYIYNARGRLQLAQSGTVTGSYRHNGLDQRALKIVKTSSANVPGETTHFIYSEHGQLIGEYESNGMLIEESIYIDYLPVAVIKPEKLSVTTSFGIYYVSGDQTNAPRVITQSTDNRIVWRWDMADPFGVSSPEEILQEQEKFSYNLRFPGQYFDRETNLHYNYYRNYDPQFGRFIESDPIGLAGGVNTYGYVGNNPLIFSDLFGLDATRRFNTTAGRGYLDGPTNGNWGGKCWSGGTYSCGGDRPVGKLPPTDSGDACYKAHDECYGAPACNTSDPSKNKIGIKACDQALLQCLGSLAEDPRLWPQPPRPGTEDDTRLYRDGALLWFR